MSYQSPWSTMLGGVLLIGFSLWNFHTTYAPPDSTPLRVVDGTVASVSTTLVHHSSKHGSWVTPMVTIAIADGGSYRFTARDRNETPIAQPLQALAPGTSVHAQVDADGEIWAVSDNGQDLITLDNTLARHHQRVRNRNLLCGFLLIVGVIVGMVGFKRLQSDNGLD